MKLKYEKPSMVIEKFEMCQNIATGCGKSGILTATMREANDCAWFDPTTTLYLWNYSIVDQCEYSPGEAGYEDICYNGPNISIVPFAS